ncbi:MAG: hypothetical protein ACRDCB_04105 [Clostridium sp.]|uniref:hypothetical protein n=1 Tax=Clostridium TaxID=1485 RepID=UPI001884024B|nr:MULTISPECIES: hypothetical protein [Clostridium]MCR6513411.1 hypothetical protein [Clostridium sp. LY3-2]
MNARKITQGALLAAILYIIYFMGSFITYFELVSFIVLLYGTTLDRKLAYVSTVIFCILVMLTKGIAPWSVMYLVIFPQFILIYSLLKKITKSEYVYALVGAILSFSLGSLIQIPYFLTAGLKGKELLVTLLLGFQVSIGNMICTVVATLFLYKPLSKVLKRVIE